MTAMRLATLDLREGNALRAPGEAPGMMALEIAIDEIAEKAGLDPVAFRIINDTQVDPENPGRPFSQRNLIGCLKTGAERFGWSARSAQPRSEEHTSELQSLMRISYAVFCLKKKNTSTSDHNNDHR